MNEIEFRYENHKRYTPANTQYTENSLNYLDIKTQTRNKTKKKTK